MVVDTCRPDDYTSPIGFHQGTLTGRDGTMTTKTVETPGDIVKGVWGSATVVTTDTLKVGDIVTEADTPNGEWYAVTKRTPKMAFISPQDAHELQIRFRADARHILLRLDA